jgi:hypothetical protein
VVVDYSETAERLGEDAPLAVPRRQVNSRFKALDRLDHGASPLVGACLPKKISRAGDLV